LALRIALTLLTGFVLATAGFILVPMAFDAANGRPYVLPDVLRPIQSIAPQNPQSQILGRFYSEQKSGEFIEFRADGTVFISLGGSPASYAVDGSTVVISTSLAGAARGTNRGDGRIVFAPGPGTIQGALAGSWARR
jgi:hypothetical protein